MINDGLLAEAKTLFPNKELNALQTVGYRELFSYFDREISLEFAIENKEKHQTIFKTPTWFKRNENTKWFDFETPYETVVAYINSKK
jgi:tRNA dimethylallyltransferase